MIDNLCKFGFLVSDCNRPNYLLDFRPLVDDSSGADFFGVGFKVEDSAHKGVGDLLEGTGVAVGECLVCAIVGNGVKHIG